MPISLIGRLTDGISIPTETLAIISQLMGRKKLLIGRKLALPISLIGNLNFVINIPDIQATIRSPKLWLCLMTQSDELQRFYTMIEKVI